MDRLRRLATLAALAAVAGCSAQTTPAAETPTPQDASPPVATSPATVAPQPTIGTVDPALDAFVRDYVKDGSMPLRYATATTGEGADTLTLVYLIGGDYCGSGGCSLLVLRAGAAGFETLGRLSVTQTPIRILESRSHGLPDLAVGISGGGATPHEVLIPFDGQRYASNPTVPPARETSGATGATLITDDTPSTVIRAE